MLYSVGGDRKLESVQVGIESQVVWRRGVGHFLQENIFGVNIFNLTQCRQNRLIGDFHYCN